MYKVNNLPETLFPSLTDIPILGMAEPVIRPIAPIILVEHHADPFRVPGVGFFEG